MFAFIEQIKSEVQNKLILSMWNKGFIREKENGNSSRNSYKY